MMGVCGICNGEGSIPVEGSSISRMPCCCDPKWGNWAPMIPFRKLHPQAKTPTRATEGSVGLDLYSVQQAIIHPGDTMVIDTGIAIGLPDGLWAQVRGRSGLAKRGILCHVGTVDTDYRGPIGVVLTNTRAEQSVNDFHVNAGDRIAQLVISPVSVAEIVEVDELEQTGRGAQGFGSSGR